MMDIRLHISTDSRPTCGSGQDEHYATGNHARHAPVAAVPADPADDHGAHQIHKGGT